MQAIVVPKLKSNLQSRAKKVANCFLSKGFPYVKVELEANVQPRNYSNQSECCDCYGSGRMHCGNCGGSGTIRSRCSTCDGSSVIENTDGQTQSCHDCDGGYREVRCPDCSDGYVECDECHGRGYFDCDDWHDEYLDAFWEVFTEKLDVDMNIIEHAHIYYDGSVDTEATFTLRSDHISKLPAIVSAFAETCRQFGGCDTGNAGLHTTLLPERKYPCH